MTTAEARAITTTICDRLRTAYASHALLPRADGLHVAPCEELKTGRCVCDGEYRLSLNLLQRLFRAVLGEFRED